MRVINHLVSYIIMYSTLVSVNCYKCAFINKFYLLTYLHEAGLNLQFQQASYILGNNCRWMRAGSEVQMQRLALLLIDGLEKKKRKS